MFGFLRKKSSKRTLVLHPLLFVVYAVLSLIAANIAWVTVEGVQGLLVTVVIILALLPVMILIFKDPQKTGLLFSVAILLILSYSHIKALTQGWRIAGVTIGQPVVLIPLGLLLFVVWIYIVLRKITDIKRVAQYFTVVGLLLLIFPSQTIGSYAIQRASLKGESLNYAEEAWKQTGGIEAEQQIGLQAGEQRDIYYIILDGYTRQDTFSDVYEYDNAWFIEALQERGFYVAEASQSNYGNTALSLGSSLNLVHVTGLPDHLRQATGLQRNLGVQDAAADMLTQNRVTQLFQLVGYEIVHFDTGIRRQELENADHYLISPELEGQDLELDTGVSRLVREMLFGQLLRDLAPGEDFLLLQQDLFDAHRERVRFTLGNVERFAKEDGNYFVFAHLISPHPPFVFGPNGEELAGTEIYTLDNPEKPFDEVIVGYREQVHYLNSLVLDAIDRILEQSETPPIIILQGDHSSRLVPPEDREDYIQGYLDAHFPILNAYYLPDAELDGLYPTITPVNSFRVVLNQYFGTGLEYLPDISYIDTFANAKYELIDICEQYRYCLKE